MMEKQLELRDDFEQELDWLLKEGLITKETDENGREIYKITEDGVKLAEAAEKAEDEELLEFT
jgi:DNA-binding PadR family transcriptional regulator